MGVPTGIKRRIFIPLILAVSVLWASFFIAFRQDQHRVAELDIQRSAQEVQRLIRVGQEEDTALMRTVLQNIVNDASLQRSFRDRDMAGLRSLATPLLKTLTSQHKITHLYFHDAHRVNFLRVHAPEKNGDLIDRFTLREAERTGEVASGLERGKTGTFVLRVVMPWRENGELIGYVEAGMESREIARELHGLLDVDFAIAVDKRLLDREQWNQGLTETPQSHRGAWDQFPEVVIVDQTMRVLPDGLGEVLASYHPGSALVASEIRWSGRVARLISLPLEEAGGKGFGELFVLDDITENIAQARKSMWIVTLISLGVSGLLLSVVYIFLVRVTKTLALQTAKLTADVKEQQRSEQALRESQQKFRQMAENITDVFWITSPDLGVMHYISPGYEAIWGRSMESLYANPHQWIEAIVPEDREEIAAAFATLTRGASKLDVEYRIARPDGTVRWVNDRGFQVRDAAGQLVRLTGIVTDITARKKIEETIQESEKRFRGYFELALTGMAITSLSKDFLEVNDELCRILGYERSELLQTSWEDLTHPDDMPADVNQFNRILAGEIDSYTLDKRFIRKDGRVIDTTISVNCVRRADGSVDYLVALAQDITERKKTEAALPLAEEKYRSIYENSNEGIFQNTPDGEVISANPALARILGYDSPEQLIHERTDLGRQSYVKPQLREKFRRQLEERGVITDFEYEVMRKDGVRIWVSENTRVVRNAVGGIAYYEGSLQDITARKRAEEELFQSRETLRGVLDNIPQRIFWKNLDLVYQGCNRAFALDMGFADTSSVLGKTDFDAVWKSVAETYRSDDQEVIDSNKGKAGFEEPGIGPGGKPRWLRTSKSPLHDWQGHVTGVLGTYEDVTEHKLAKIEIERLNVDLERRVTERTRDLVAVTAEAERANRAKSQFLSRTSHELRTPMNAILGFGQLLEMEETLVPEQRESVEQILNAGRHLLTLIDEVLDISNAESGSIALSPEPLQVEPLIMEAISLVRPLCATLRVTLEPPILPPGDWMVQADPQRLRQVLLNLLSNAIKYNRPGGTVQVECAPVEEAEPPFMRFCVKDTGTGISPPDLLRLFTPFDRLGAESTRPHVVGTGLGLALSKRLMELMGGALEVESKVGQGTTFWIDVPLSQGVAVVDQPAV